MLLITKNQLIKDYLDKKLSSYKIAKKYNCTPTWINVLRKKYKIRTLKPHERNPLSRLSQRQKAYIYGSLLGDGSLKINRLKRNSNAYLSIAQSETHKNYVEFQYSIMEDFINAEIKIDKRTDRKNMIYFRTISHPIFTRIYKEIYPNGVKTISNHWLKQLTPLSFAIWYMDDGSIVQSNHQMRISTESFSYQEHLLIQKYLKIRWNIFAGIKESSRKGKFILSFRAKERDNFFKLIKQYIIPGMKYKIYNGRKKWREWSPFEIKYLKQNYLGRKTNWKRMLVILDHSREAILRKASYLSLTRQNKI
ncbi:MAG: hypothetical protein ABIH40_01255 [Candidatus Omnitrophota bacterium]